MARLFIKQFPMSKAEEVFDKMMQKDYCSQWLGIVPVEIGEGHCTLRMKVRKEMLNGFGIMHGGIAYAFADSALAFAANSYGRLSVSINGAMSFVQSAREGDILIAEARALHIGNKTADFEVVVYKEGAGEKFYFFRGTVYRTSKQVIDSD